VSTQAGLLTSPVRGVGAPLLLTGRAVPGTPPSGLPNAGVPGLSVSQLLPGVPSASEKSLQIEVERLKTELAAEKKAREEWAAFVPASLGASEHEARAEAERLRGEMALQKRLHEHEIAGLHA
jgi:hypothetical protein